MPSISNTPRDGLLGYLADALRSANDYADKKDYRGQTYNPPLHVLSGLLGIPAFANTLNRMSYGEDLTRGSGETLQMLPDTAASLLSVAPYVGPAAKATAKGVMATGKFLAPAAGDMLENYMVKTGGILPATVWHGSPHKFDAFDASKIGTGEGAQAYGHGLYLAESPSVAKSYQDALSMDAGYTFSGKQGLSRQQVQDLVNAREGEAYLDGVSKPSMVADHVMDSLSYGNKNPAPRGYKDGSARSQLYGKLMSEIEHPDKGNLYKVDLPDEYIAKMLDYDNPVPEAVFKPLSKAALDQFGSGLTDTSGEKLYKEMIFNFKQAGHPNPTQAATDWLTQQGVPGMRYLDGGSRGAGQGSSNFVVFPGNEGLLNILERNGQPVNGLLGKQGGLLSAAPISNIPPLPMDAESRLQRMQQMGLENGWYRGGKTAADGPWYTKDPEYANNFDKGDVREYALPKTESGEIFKAAGPHGYNPKLANDLSDYLRSNGMQKSAEMLDKYYPPGSNDPVHGQELWQFLSSQFGGGDIGAAGASEALANRGFKGVRGVNNDANMIMFDMSRVRDAKKAQFDPNKATSKDIFSSLLNTSNLS